MVRLIAFGLIGAVIGWLLLGALRQVVGPELVSLLVLAIVVVVIVVAMRNLATNRRVPDAAPEMRAQALTFAPDVAKATLYILRTQFVGKAVGVNVVIDGRDVAQVKSPRFTRVLLTPGAHGIGGYTGTAKKPEDKDLVALNANAGEIIVMMCAVEPQMIGTIVKFTPVTLEKARADLQKTRMIAPDVAEV